MKAAVLCAAIGLLALARPGSADPIDCGNFPNGPSRFSCYESLSRGPKPEPERAAALSDRPKPKAIRKHRSRRID